MWVKLNDQAPNDPDIDALSDGAFRLWITAICYCQAQLTDGYVSTERIKRLIPRFKPSYLDELTKTTADADTPIFVAAGDGYIIRNFVKWNKDRAYWAAKRQADAERIAAYRSRRTSP